MRKENLVNSGDRTQFEPPTPQQRVLELTEVAQKIGGSLSVVHIGKDGSTTSYSGNFPEGEQMANPNEGIILIQKQKRYRKPEQKRMKDNQVRHSRNLGQLTGMYNGRYYTNGQPPEHHARKTNEIKKNGREKH